MMSRVFTLTFFCLFLAVSAQNSFPKCEAVLESFAERGINLFFNGQRVRNVLSAECLIEDMQSGELQLHSVYYCASGLLDENFQEITRSFDTIHDFNDEGDVVCSNTNRVELPPPTIPPITLECPETSVPTEVSQYEDDAKLCAKSCLTLVKNSQGKVTRIRPRTIVLCCENYELMQPSAGRFSLGRFSFVRRLPARCVPKNTL